MELLPISKQRLVLNSVDTTALPFFWPKPFVVWVANIKPAKRPELYVRLATQFKNRDVDFLMVGSIQSKDYDWIKTEHTNLKNFHYLGPKTLEEVNGILSQSMFLVHTCKPEGFANNLIQAWFQRKPTITFEFDPAGYIKKYAMGGASNSDWSLFVDQVNRLIENSEERNSAGKRAYEFASQNFSISKTVQEIENFMYEIALI